MTIREAIARADALRPNAVDTAVKAAWLCQLDGTLRRSVTALHQPAADEAAGGADRAGAGDGDAVLLADGPDEALYLYWLMAQTDLAEGELTRYANDMQLYNAALTEFAAHYKAAHRPLPRGQFRY